MVEPKKYQTLIDELSTQGCKLVAVSKRKSKEDILVLYGLGQRIFGENRVQELVEKQPQLPDDIEWHMIGHLQTNKVKYIAPFISMIHSIDSLKLAERVNKEAVKINRKINVLLQVDPTDEETKYGFEPDELANLWNQGTFSDLENITICGIMAMATNTSDQQRVAQDFEIAKQLFDQLKASDQAGQTFNTLSIGMSGDYLLALEHGSTLVRIGSLLFGARG